METIISSGEVFAKYTLRRSLRLGGLGSIVAENNHISAYLLLQGKIILNLFWCVYFLSACNGDVGVSTFFPG